MELGNYDSKEAEPRIQKFWEQKSIFKFDEKSKKKLFSIDTPPPTVSGKMHMGHAFSYTQQDFIARYKRMQNYNVFYPFGTDDNGLATERLIEKEKNIKATQMSRQEFIDICLKELNTNFRPKYIQDWKRIGMSCDFSLFYTTINKHCQKISQKSFIDLYKQGREYRKESPTIFCPECQTAIAQVELQDKELQSTFNDLKFKLKSGEEITIATTRPELLPACVAIFIHPEDKKNKHLLGKKAIVPLFNQEVPILEDKRVSMEKGSGIVMCCTFGDQTDIEWYRAHQLPLKIAINKQGLMTELAGKYQGQKIKEARKKILEDLKHLGVLTKQTPIKHIVNVHERCGTEIEILNTNQWFIKYLDLKEQFLKAGSQLKWHPEHMQNRLDNWIKGLQWDWCISRQRYFGIPFPVWYCTNCQQEILAEESQLPVDPLVDKPKIKSCPKCRNNKFTPEKDVLDTWATSSLTPEIAIELKPKLRKKLFPMDLRPQSHDIITFWLFNTLAKSQLHNKKNPWKNIMISGWVLDPSGNKMSKSKGNIIEPQNIVQQYSADTLRYWASSSKLGEDLAFQEKNLVTGQKTVNKLWNASKFSIQHLQNYKLKKPKKLETIDSWMLANINELAKSCTESFENYDYQHARAEVDNFFWNTFCDFYLEIIKDRLYNPDKRGKKEQESALYTLYHSLLAILKLWAPIMPYITEEIYQKYFITYEKQSSIHLLSWPKHSKKEENKKLQETGKLFLSVVKEARMFKTQKNKSLKEPILLQLPNEYKKKFDKSLIADLISTTNSEISFGKELEIKLKQE
ncbi:MAG TPA: valine--tRNA ligase [Candidatus Nanoarchaeia archaeon]|nr:valine--tRNA ligase [Candidatus Nanoarchaeia archaeon]